MLSHINIGYHSETICTLWSEVAQSCPTLCDPMDYSLPGFSIHRIFQARVLEWVAISFTRGSTWHKDQIWVSRIAGRGVTLRATMSSHMHSQFSSVQFSRSVASDPLRTHESQYDKPPCPSPTPRVYSNACPSNR